MAATASSAAATTTATPTVTNAGGASTTGVETYEDMFKEITRKLYGEETGHGLHTLGTPIAHLATSGPTLPEGERSFTTLMSDRAGNSIDFTNDPNSSKDHLFGLAALMQNGFAQPPGSIMTPHNFSPSSVAGNNKTASPSLGHDDGQRWSNVVGGVDNGGELLQWNVNQPTTNKHPNSKSIKKEGDAKRNSQSGNSVGAGTSMALQGSKRYTCGTCPYSTDRRDLYTRHENIHKTEKPFHCYACLKQFNRADHVKKHFLRMHRELQYDINKTRRSVQGRSPAAVVPAPPNSSAVSATPQYYGAPQHAQSNAYNGQPSQEHQLPDAVLQNNTINMIQHATHHLVHQQSIPVVAVQHQTANGTEQMLSVVKVKQEKTSTAVNSSSPPKKKGDKRFVCCYCPWTGADNWGLKRHLNTHTKPYVCILCDYKAARSERLVTHVYKVHNKKACSKCSFLADDHAQFLAHQSEAHPVDSRARHGGNNNHNNSAATQSSVLRAIGNTNSTTLATGNGSVSQSMAIFGHGFNNGTTETWRPASAATTQKRGAERLFAYMEADSDPEDYNKQLQMTALSRSARNTVAQDFHNAGGGVTTTSTKSELNAKRSTAPSGPAQVVASLFANKGYQQKFIRDLEEFIVQRLITSDGPAGESLPTNGQLALNLNRSTTMNTPPPAKRRRCSSHDKENYRHGKAQRPKVVSQSDSTITTATTTDRGQLNAQMREIFHTLSQHYGEQMLLANKDTENASVPSCSSGKKKSNSLEEIERILKNNHELTISIKDNQSACIKYSNGDSGLDDEEEDEDDQKSPKTECSKSKRKQFVPRKIGFTESRRDNFAIWNAIRDKHLSRLMSHRKSCCRICVQQQSSLIIPYHSLSSLILHKRWRHCEKMKQCGECQYRYKLPYQLILHRKLSHN